MAGIKYLFLFALVVIVTVIYFTISLVITSRFRGSLRTKVRQHTVQSTVSHTDLITYEVPKNIHDFQQEAQNPSKNNKTDYNIIILTPFEDSVLRLEAYFQLLCNLTYPHERISIGLGQDTSPGGRNRSYQIEQIVDTFRPSFRDVTFYQLEHAKSNITHRTRHDKSTQPTHRQHMAISRNELLFRAIKGDHDWVMWLDVDLGFIPPNLIQLLLSPNQPIVAPACVQYKPFQTYDRNLWRETDQSRAHIAKQKSKYGDDFLMIEYNKVSLRMRLVDLRHEGKVVRIDGVGGCCLLINASCHRQGLIFPPFVFDSHIETEGLAKMAAKMGFPVYGLPFVQVFHDMKSLYTK